MNRAAFRPRRGGFTLIELLLGMAILAMVTVSVYSMVDVATYAYSKGLAAMEEHQSARIGLRRAAEELRYSLSRYSFWEPNNRFEVMTFEQMMANLQLANLVEEEDPGAIRFLGEPNAVLFVRKVFQFGQELPFDLQECAMYVNPESEQLILEVLRSLLMVKRATWQFQAEFETNLQGIIMPHNDTRVRVRQKGPYPEEPPLELYIGDYGRIGQKYLIAEHVKKIEFRYSDGGSYKNTWDSQELVRDYRVSPQSPNFNALSDVVMRDKGPPLIVEIKLEMSNGETLITATDIPGGNMHNQLGGFNPGQSGGGPGIAQPAPQATPAGQPQPPRPANETGITLPGVPRLPRNPGR